jgi:hypothetical protein
MINTCFVAGCYNAPVGGPAYQANVQRVIARVFANGSIDTSLIVTDAFFPPCVFSGVVSPDGVSDFWMVGSQFSSSAYSPTSPSPSPFSAGVPPSGGLRYYRGNTGTTNSTQLYNNYPVNAVTLIPGLGVWVSKNYISTSSYPE